MIPGERNMKLNNIVSTPALKKYLFVQVSFNPSEHLQKTASV
jgi:hypothetical protein